MWSNPEFSAEGKFPAPGNFAAKFIFFKAEIDVSCPKSEEFVVRSGNGQRFQGICS
jgi:hypothetical protein